jgi:predicted ATPase
MDILMNLSPHVSNLPAQPTAFIGRASEIAELSALLNNDDCSLLSLVGAGGMGKTRLSIEVASHQLDKFADGVFFVPLAPLSAPENIVTSIANAIGLHISGEGTPQEQLLDYLEDRQILLVMDNFEHLLDGVHIVVDILLNSAHVKILVTSREALNLQEEWVRQVTGMRFPDTETIESVEPYSALKLFMERAHRIRGDFDDLGCAIRICQLVGGMPLAIELATAWLKVMPCEKILQEIQRNLDFLVTKARNTDERHRSIRAVFDQSWQLLSEDEQAVLSRLSVFHGGFELDAAEQVAGASLFILAELVEKSLLRITASGRYEFHELLRQYAQQQLEATSGIDAIQDAHGVYYLYFLAEREDDIKGRRQFEALGEIETDFENVRTAWIRAVDQENYDDLNTVIECLDWFCAFRGHWQEGRELFRYSREGLTLARVEDPHLVWGRIVIRDEAFHGFTPLETVWKQIEQCLAWAEQHDDQLEVAYCLNSFGNAMFEVGTDYDISLHYWSEALTLYTELNDTHYVAWLHLRIGKCYGAMKQGAKFTEYMHRSYDLMREKGDHLGGYDVWMDLGLRPENNSNLINYETEGGDTIDNLGIWHGNAALDIEQGKLNFFDGYLEKASELISRSLKHLPTLNQPIFEQKLVSFQ